MKRKLLSGLLCLLLLSSLVLNVSAADNQVLVIDNAGLLSSDEVSSLETLAKTMTEAYRMDIVLLTVETTGYRSVQDYADDFYEDNGYGQGSFNSGILFLLDMEEREWYISTCGDAIYAVTDYGVQQLGEAALDYLSAGNYYDAFLAYLAELQMYLDAYQLGAPIDGYADYSGDYYHGQREENIYYEEDSSPSLLLSLIIGFVAAAVSVGIMRASMNTKRSQRGAAEYMKPGSYHLIKHQDLFLYSNITKTRRQENKPSSGGGSSVHRSSGGRRHGGGGGKF